MANGPRVRLCTVEDAEYVARLLRIPNRSTQDPHGAAQHQTTAPPRSPATGHHSPRAGHTQED